MITITLADRERDEVVLEIRRAPGGLVLETVGDDVVYLSHKGLLEFISLLDGLFVPNMHDVEGDYDFRIVSDV